ncbi:MAG: hypothetical protein JW888_13135 [Pirellulales bacterium]|nr:hypothetical protein [Pirellulales bacterium]
MQARNEEIAHPRLPLPRWCFVLLAVPTFYMPLAYLLLIGVAIGSTVFVGHVPRLPAWLGVIAHTALCVTVVMGPVYLLWAALSKRLTWKEKIPWLLMIVLGNMVAMPFFYVFMVRRYLGVEDRTSPRDEAALDAFLTKHNIQRTRLSIEQVGILQSYCRTRRVNRWCLLPWIVTVVLTFFMAFIYIPRFCTRVFADTDSIPARVVVVDKVGDSREEVISDPAEQNEFVQMVFMFGAMAGAFGTLGFFFFALAIPQIFGNQQLVKFARAAGDQPATGSS